MNRSLGEGDPGHAAACIISRLLASGFSGYDPYDGLNTLGGGLVNKSAIAGRILTQAVKRCPVPLQPLLGAPRCVSATTIGYGMLALARLRQLGEEPFDVARAAVRLRENALQCAVLSSTDELAWGSHVDVVTRFGHTPRTTPNVVVTHTVTRGFAALAEAGLADERDAFTRIGQFIVRRLHRSTSDGATWFAYTPEGDTMFHNATMLAAATLVRCGVATSRDDLLVFARRGAATVASYQQPNGAWLYAEHSRGRWEDSFHTGFILEGLLEASLHDSSGRVQEAVRRGAENYCRAYFGSRGQPFYSVENHYPFDSMSAAQALETLPELAGLDERFVGLNELVRIWVSRHMLGPDGRVAYQVHRRWTDWREFPRWSQAPMAAALTAQALWLAGRRGK